MKNKHNITVRIEIYERYLADGEYTKTWWEENMPEGAPMPMTYGYRRTLPLLDEIDRPIEIPGNLDECIVRFFSGEEIIVKGNYDEFCIFLNDMENTTEDEE